MSEQDLYAELKPEIEELAVPLFDASERFVRKNRSFLPHGAILPPNRESRLVMAATPDFEKRAVSD
jgi:hypothetical protein